MADGIVLTKSADTGAGEWRSFILVGGDVSQDDAAINFLVFKDTTNGKKYKLQVTNGAIELVEVT